MSFLKIVKGQDKADELLGRSFSKGRLAHAYLFAGPSGVGRFTASLELAAAHMCEEIEDGYCGECRDCTRVFGFQHPDVRFTIPKMGSTEPEEIAKLLQSRLNDGITPLRLPGNTRISIADIRELTERLSRKAFENKGHIEIIPDADRMGVEAANALLKTLEEPPDNTVIILISSRWSALLPTVRSRSHLIRFRRLPDETIRDILMDRMDIGESEAFDIARCSDGRPGSALILRSSASVPPAEFEPHAALLGLAKKVKASEAISLATAYARGLRREGSLEFCRNMQTFIHDLRRDSLGRKPVVHPEDTLKDFTIDDDALDTGLELFRKAEARLAGNGGPGLVLSAAFTGMWKSMTVAGKESVE